MTSVEGQHFAGWGDPRFPPLSNKLVPYLGMDFLDVQTGKRWLFTGEIWEEAQVFYRAQTEGPHLD